jgi:hypothetical protein
MSKWAHDIFFLVINFLRYDWETKQMTIGLFEATKTTSQALTNNLTIVESIWVRKKIVVYVKDERSNLNIMTIVLKLWSFRFG